MNPVRAALVTAAASANNIVTSTTPVSGTALTLNGTTVSGGVATLDVARRVLVTYGVEASARTLTITGTDRFGTPQSETLAIPSGAGGTIGTQRDFATVTSALPLGGGWSAAMTLGTSAIASTAWFMREWGQIGKMGVLISIPTAGPTCQLECTWDDPNTNNATWPGFTPWGASATPEPQSAVPPLVSVAPASEAIFNPSTGLALAAQSWAGVTTPGAISAFDVPVFAIRMTQTAGSGTSILQFIETTGDRKQAF